MENRGMRVNMNKTKVMISGEHQKLMQNPVISTGHTNVDIGASAKRELVDKFCYECGWRCRCSYGGQISNWME